MGRIIVAAAAGFALCCSALLGSASSAFAQSTGTAQDTTNTGETLWVATTQRIKSKIYQNARPKTDAFGRFPISMQNVLLVIATPGDTKWLEEEIRSQHGWLSFQQPDKVADAISDAGSALEAASVPAGSRWLNPWKRHPSSCRGWPGTIAADTPAR